MNFTLTNTLIWLYGSGFAANGDDNDDYDDKFQKSANEARTANECRSGDEFQQCLTQCYTSKAHNEHPKASFYRKMIGSIGGILNIRFRLSSRKEEPYDEKPSGTMEEVIEAGSLIRHSISIIRQRENVHGCIISATT
ncbi:hypothetical protein CSKR_111611 [Clonorchis sinensis]|uniref:Uncharacterized protein n=2 Tax=Clonorchis sinensis TaxID=79923 RepID=G7Y4K2_CLOSI|nr:hypothetical protein CSKR_111611 [Clonorchis sinensis]GAA47888.1 hypothetical protein CLF_100930 [Clonorchis sinensis]